MNLKGKLTCILVSGGILTCFAGNAMAACERETRERNEFKGHYNTAAKAAAVACATGSIFTIVTFGASLAPCAAAGITANNQKRILDEKETNLARCEERYLREQRQAAERALLREARVRAIQSEYDNRRTQIIRHYEGLSQNIPNEFAAEGYDLTHPAILAEIKEKQSLLQEELNRVLAEIEENRQREFAGV